MHRFNIVIHPNTRPVHPPTKPCPLSSKHHTPTPPPTHPHLHPPPTHPHPSHPHTHTSTPPPPHTYLLKAMVTVSQALIGMKVLDTASPYALYSITLYPHPPPTHQHLHPHTHTPPPTTLHPHPLTPTCWRPWWQWAKCSSAWKYWTLLLWPTHPYPITPLCSTHTPTPPPPHTYLLKAMVTVSQVLISMKVLDTASP